MALIYHNITPTYFFAGVSPSLAESCEAGRRELRELALICERAFGYARFSAEELSAAGFTNVGLMPFTVDWQSFDVPPDAELLRTFTDDQTNVLFVGRAVPNKRLDDVFRVFSAYQRLYNPNSRLIIAGHFNVSPSYSRWLETLGWNLGLNQLHYLGHVTAEQLSACYEVADVYLSMSHHEGLGVPIIESMHRGVPVVAYGAAAVPETLGGAGLVSRTNDPIKLAKLLAVLDQDPKLRDLIITQQRNRVRAFSRELVLERLRQALTPLLDEEAVETGPASTDEPEILFVCPRLDTNPDHPSCVKARELARALAPRAIQILTLKASGWPSEPAPERSTSGGSDLLKFSPEMPIDPKDPNLPYSSSLQTAVLASDLPVVFFGREESVCRYLLPRMKERAFVVSDASERSELLIDRLIGALSSTRTALQGRTRAS